MKSDDQAEKYPLTKETYAILGACFDVYNEKGCGFLEAVYQECLAIEFSLRNVPFAAQKKLDIEYKGYKLNQTYSPDFLCFDKVVLEIKAVEQLADEHRAQLINYLNAAGCEIGLLVNFGHFPKLEYERLIYQQKGIVAESEASYLCLSVLSAGNS